MDTKKKNVAVSSWKTIKWCEKHDHFVETNDE